MLCLQLSLIVVGSILTVSIMRPYIFIAAIPLGIIFVILRKYFLRTGQQLKLLEAEGENEWTLIVALFFLFHKKNSCEVSGVGGAHE